MIEGDDGAHAPRERILRVAATLFADKGYRSVGVAELGEQVGLGRGALYYHIGSKEELLYDIVSRYITELVEAGEQVAREQVDPRSKIQALSRHMLNVVSRNRAEMTVCFRESDCLTGERLKQAGNLHSRYQSLWVEVFAEGSAAKIFRDVHPVAIKGLLGMYFHSFLWLRAEGRNSADQVADVFADIVLRTLSPDTVLDAAFSPPATFGLSGGPMRADAPSPRSRPQGRAQVPKRPSASRPTKP